MQRTTDQEVLAEFRDDIFRRLSIIVAISSLITGLSLVFVEPLAHQLIFTLQVFGLFVIYIRYLARYRPNFARYTLVGSLYAILAFGMLMLPLNWLPFLIAPLLFVSELLTSRLSIVASVLVIAFAALLVRLGHANYPLQGLILFSGFAFVVANGCLRTIWTLLEWYRSMFSRSSILLEEARIHRAELLSTLKALEIAHDAQRRLQTQLIYARQQAEEAQRLKERFASNISHELRTPLNIILGFSEIMHLTPEVYGTMSFPPKLQQDIYQIHRNSRHLLDMIDDVLDLSHIELTEFTLNFERTDLNKFLEDTVDLVAHLFTDKPVTFNVKIQPCLPEIQIDRTRIRQAIINLLNNAHRFTFKGSVTFAVYATENDIVFDVIDTGIGIPQDQMQLIFEEFFQVDYSLSRSTGGAGLGLAITRRFVEAHNGNLSVKSELSVGSTFTFTLPLPIPVRPSLDLAKPVQFMNQEPLWLVVEADPLVSKLIARHVPECSIVQIDYAEQIKSAINRYSPQGIILNNSRDEVIDTALIDWPIPVVVCSLPSTAKMVAQLGVNGCLSKPILSQQLIDCLRAYQSIKTVLVVDDDLGVVQLVQRILENSYPDLVIQRAYGGEQACQMMKVQVPDLVLLDLAMPQVSGFEVIGTMKQSPLLHRVPIVLLTATKYVNSDHETRGGLHIQQQGGLKPMTVLKLLNAISQCLSD